MVWEVVDGQQRITTIYLTIMAAVEILAREGEADFAAAVSGTYLIVRPLASNPVNTKLIPSYADRGQFASIWTRIASMKELKENRSFAFNPPMPPAPSGPLEGEMTAQYSRLRRLMGKIYIDSGKDGIEKYIRIIAHHMSVVSISLRDPAVAPKIFERLNSRAEPVTIADLVRNEIFSRSGDNILQAQHIFNTYWEPFIDRFKKADVDLDKFLFPYGLAENPNVKKAELFPHLRSRWIQFNNPQEIINDLDKYRGVFFALEAGINDAECSVSINKWLSRIHDVGRPSSTYSFIFKLIDSFKSENLDEKTVCEILEAVESFLFRRAIFGIEPTGLHSGFKGLWWELGESGDGINSISFKRALARKPTILWPTDEQFTSSIKQADLYNKKVRNYAIREFEFSLKGETPSDSFVVEHIAPQTPTENWKAALGQDYQELLHTWGNLIPLTDKMNPSVGHKDFLIKRDAFKNSIFASAREVATSEEGWTAQSIRDRNSKIAEWALRRWRL